jgi:methyl-accepting chemotaxis protein
MMLALWQGTGIASSAATINTTLLTIFVGIVALSFVTNTIIFIVMAIAAAKARKKAMSLFDDLHAKALPLIAKAHPIMDSVSELIRETSPKIKTVTDNLVQTSDIVRAKAQEMGSTVTDVNEKTRQQADRVNSMVTTALTAVSDLGTTIHHGIRVPVRQVAGVIDGIKTTVDSYLHAAKKGGGANIVQGLIRGFTAGRGPRAPAPISPPQRTVDARSTIDPRSNLDS